MNQNRYSREEQTPVPTSELVALTQAVVKVDVNVESIMEQIPLIRKDTQEARDKARESLSAVTSHLSHKEAHQHACTENDRQNRQDEELYSFREVKPRLSGLSKLVWWMLGLIVLGVGSVISFAVVVRTEGTANATRIESQSANIMRHEKEIDSIEKVRTKDREVFLKEVRALPSNFRKASREEPTLDEMEDVIEDLPFTRYEKRTIKNILQRAKLRSKRQQRQ